MYSDSDVMSVYSYLKGTPEGPLRKMMVGGQFAEAHFRVLLKIVRGCAEAEFIEMFNTEGMPKIRLSAAELPLKETLWPLTKMKLTELGLLTPMQQPKAA